MLLLTGATGFVGQAVCEELRRRGASYRIAARRPAPELARDVVEVPDISGITDWSRALDGVDVVVHLAGLAHLVGSRAQARSSFHAVNVDGTMALARAASARPDVRRFVYLSSAKAAGERSGPVPLRETDPANPVGAYAISKWQAEEGLRRLASDTGLSCTIIRTPLVYGPGVRANFLSLMRAVDRELPLPFGSVRNARSFIYVRNLANALLECAEHEGAHGETFYVKDGPDPSTPQLVKQLAAALHRKARLIPVPPMLLKAGASMLGKGDALERLIGSFAVDARHIRDSVGWTAPFTMDEGLANTAVWYAGVRTS